MMVFVAFAVPILPGKMDAWKDFVRTLAKDRINEYEKSRNRAGIKKEVAWIQNTPQGDMAIVYIEAKDIPKAIEHFGKSQESFDVWFRDMVREIHGVDFTHPQALPALGFEWPAG